MPSVQSMAEYKPTAGDLEMGVQEKTMVLVEKKSSTKWMWKVSGALLIAALCLGGVLMFAWKWNGGPDMMNKSGQPEARTDKDTNEKTEPHVTLKRISSKAKAAIHLEGNYDEEDKNMKEVEWKSGQGQGFAQGGLHLEKNQISIPYTGLYFVYSQASFRVSCSDDDDEEGAGKRFTPLSHRIWRLSDSIGNKASLMSAVRSVCQSTAQEDSDGQGWYSAIYLGAVFKLNRGDKLWTETNQLSQLETNDGNTFFGVFAL